MSSAPSPRKRKPGPKPMRPTKRQRHQVEVGVSIGLTVDQIATAVAIPRHTIYRHSATSWRPAAPKRLLANAVRFDAMAEAGNVSAAKFLHTLMMQQSETVEPDPWATVVQTPGCRHLRQADEDHRGGESKRSRAGRGGGTRKRNDHQPHAQGPCRTTMHGQIKANGSALPCACGAGLAGVSDARRSRRCAGGQKKWKLQARRAVEGHNCTFEVDQITALTNVRFRG